MGAEQDGTVEMSISEEFLKWDLTIWAMDLAWTSMPSSREQLEMRMFVNWEISIVLNESFAAAEAQ